MNAFLPLQFSGSDSPVRPVVGKMSPLDTAYSLEGISSRLYAGLSINSRDHAIPHTGAYVDYLRDAALSPDKQSDSYVKAWRGLLAMIGLNNLYSFDLSVETVSLAAPATKLCKAYKPEMKRLGLLDGADNYYIIKRGNSVLGVLHPRILVCPFKNLRAEALHNVPWYDQSRDEWLDPAEGNLLTAPEKHQLASWLESQLPSANQFSPELAGVLKKWIDQLRGGSAGVDLINPSPLPGALAAGSFGAISSAFFSLPDFEVPLRMDIFTPRLHFTYVQSLSTTSKLTPNFRDDSQMVCQVLPPLTSAFAEKLTDSWQTLDPLTGKPLLELVSLYVSRDAFMANGEVTIHADIRNGGLMMRRSHTYSAENMVYVDCFPYFSMWPYVNFAPENRWNLYYVTMLPMNNGAPAPSRCGNINANEARLMFKADRQDIKAVTPKAEASKYKHYVLATKSFPRYIPLHYTDQGIDREAGVLVVEPPANMINSTGMKASAAIDFGTSNSVCAVKCGSTTYEILNGRERVKSLVAFSSDVEIQSFHRYYSIPMVTHAYKFPSVAQMHDDTNSASNEPVLDGQILLSEGGVISHFASMTPKLEDKGIFTYLKTNRKVDASEPRYYAEQLFVKQLALLCALEAKCKGAQNIVFYFSYPNEIYKRVLSVFWTSAVSYIEEMGIFTSVSQDCMTERDASAYYVQNSGSVSMAASAMPGFAVVDIGGGTSDMTVWRDVHCGNSPTNMGSFSLKYAGNQLFSSTFFNYFKKNPTMLTSIFTKLFDVSRVRDASITTRVTETVNSYISSIGAVSSTRDEGFPALTALLNSLFEEPGINKSFWNGAPCADLRNILCFKLKAILYVLGFLVVESNGIDPRYGTFKIFLVGGGSQAYEMVNPMTFDEEAFQMLSEFVDTENGIGRFSLTPPSNRNKTEVVDGMLQFKTDINNQGIVADAIHQTYPREKITPKVLRNSYRRFVDVTVRRDPNLEDLLPVLDIPAVAQDPSATQEQIAADNRYQSVFATIWAETNSDVDKDTSEYIRLAAFSARVAEEMLS